MALEKSEELFNKNFYVPTFTVKVKGKELAMEARHDIVNVSYTDSLEKIDSFSFTVTNWNAENREFKYLDFTDTPFNVGNDVEVWMGYGGEEVQMIKGEITSLEPDYPQSGNPTLNVRGLNYLHRLRTKQETHYYKNKTDRYIAGKIAQRLGLEKGTIEGDEQHELLVQQNRYDIVFLMERARRLGYELLVKEGKLFFQPSTDEKEKAYILEWGKSLINFRPTLTTSKQVSQVIVKGWSPKEKKVITGKAKRSDLKTKGLGSSKINKIVEKAFEKRIEIIVDKPITDNRMANDMAKNKLEQIAKGMVTGEGSTIGLPDLTAGSIVELKGLGDTFSGRYFVSGTTHSMGESGYTTKFSVRREEVREK